MRPLIFFFMLVLSSLLAGCSTYGDITAEDMLMGDPYTLAAKTDAIFKENWAYLTPAHFEQCRSEIRASREMRFLILGKGNHVAKNSPFWPSGRRTCFANTKIPTLVLQSAKRASVSAYYTKATFINYDGELSVTRPRGCLFYIADGEVRRISVISDEWKAPIGHPCTSVITKRKNST